MYNFWVVAALHDNNPGGKSGQLLGLHGSSGHFHVTVRVIKEFRTILPLLPLLPLKPCTGTVKIVGTLRGRRATRDDVI